MEQLQKHEFNNWLKEPVTKKVREAVLMECNFIREEWAQGRFKDDQIENAYQRGRINGMMEVFQLEI